MATTLEFFPEAESRFNELAEELRKQVRPISRDQLASERQSFKPDTVPSFTLTEKDVGDIPYVEQIHALSQSTQRVLYDDGTTAFELPKNGCTSLQELVEKLSQSNIGKMVSSRTLRRHVLLWLSPHKLDERKLSERLIAELSPRIHSYQAWVPIANLHLESPLPFGPVTFRSIPAELIDGWKLQSLRRRPESSEQIEERFKGRRVRYQGLAAATIELEAEEDRASEIACEEAEDSTALLRTFCAENLHPLACSYCVPIGRHAWLSDELFLLNSDRKVVGARANVIQPLPIPWVISDAQRIELNRMGLQDLVAIRSTHKLSDFQKKLISALLIYNRGNVTRDSVEKLVYILVALESMLLRDQGEPIQVSIGERLAFVVGKDVAERRQIAALAKSCYSIRSRLIHHGENLEDISRIERFLMYSWVFFTRLIRKHQQFESKQALLDDLERRKFE